MLVEVPDVLNAYCLYAHEVHTFVRVGTYYFCSQDNGYFFGANLCLWYSVNEYLDGSRVVCLPREHAQEDDMTDEEPAPHEDREATVWAMMQKVRRGHRPDNGIPYLECIECGGRTPADEDALDPVAIYHMFWCTGKVG